MLISTLRSIPEWDRIGFPVNSESVNLIEEISKLPNIHMEGLFTHFAKQMKKKNHIR